MVLGKSFPSMSACQLAYYPPYTVLFDDGLADVSFYERFPSFLRVHTKHWRHLEIDGDNGDGELDSSVVDGYCIEHSMWHQANWATSTTCNIVLGEILFVAKTPQFTVIYYLILTDDVEFWRQILGLLAPCYEPTMYLTEDWVYSVPSVS